MKTLLIGRHGEKLYNPEVPDWNLHLTNTGISQCRMNGNSLVLKGIKPDFLLCSSSQRTRASLEALMSQIIYEDSPPEVELCGKALYTAYDAASMVDVISTHLSDQSQCPLVMGHNPGMHYLAQYLSQNSQPHLVDAISRDFPSSTLCVFNVSCGRWAAMSPDNTELVHILSGHGRNISKYNLPSQDL